MNNRLFDTNPAMESLQIKLLRQVSPARKLEMLAELNSAARLLALTGLRDLYKQDSEERLQRRLADLLLGPELARKVYGDAEDVT